MSMESTPIPTNGKGLGPEAAAFYTLNCDGEHRALFQLHSRKTVYCVSLFLPDFKTGGVT